MKRFITAFLCFLFANTADALDAADDDMPLLGAPLKTVERHFKDQFADPRAGLRYASCQSLDPNAGGPAEAFLVFLPPDKNRFNRFDAAFFWVVDDDAGKAVSNFAGIILLEDDMEVGAVQGGLWIDEAMERTIRPLMNTHPRVAYSAEEIFQRPRGRCRYSPPSNYRDGQEAKPRHRPKIKPEWFSAK